MTEDTLFEEILNPASRADPYPLYERARQRPVARQHDGRYVVSTHAAIRKLIFDPRLSSEDLPPVHRPRTGRIFRDLLINPIKDHITNAHRPLIFRDPPDHDVLRGFVMEQFSVPRVRAVHRRVEKLVNRLIDACHGRSDVCLVEDLSYPLPVAVICDLLGVPESDEPIFQRWATQLSSALEPDARRDDATRRANIENFEGISSYMRDLIREKRHRPQDDMLSGLAAPDRKGRRRMSDFDLISTAALLLVAGHETTVNLITNGMLTLLRHPGELARLKRDAERAPRLIEELLRFEPPVHFRTRRALGDIETDGETIPKDASVVLLFAAANRDPARFAEPQRFNPDRDDNQHFGFGGGLHYCIGAPLARIEVEISLVTLCRRLVKPRLAYDPPPYRPGAALRGPEKLGISIEAIV